MTSAEITPLTRTTEEIQDWMVDYMAALLQVDSDEIDIDIPFDRFGLDSASAICMTGDLEDWLGLEIDPTLLYDYPTIGSMSAHLSESARAA